MIVERSQETFPGLTPAQIEVYTAATKSLRAQATEHAHLGRFQLIQRPEDYYQDFREVYLPPVDEPNLEIVDNTCQAIMGKDRAGQPNFDKLLDAFRSNSETINRAKELMDSGGRLLLITPHRELVDVAMAMAAFQCEVDDSQLIKSTRIFVGPIIKELEIQGYQAIKALQFSSGVLIGFPDTASTNKRIESGEIDPMLKKAANDTMLKEFSTQIIHNEIRLVATAPSGSTDDETEEGIIKMKPVSRATNILARRYFDSVLPVALILHKGEVICEVGYLLTMDRLETLHDVMENQLAPMYERVSGKKVVYQRPEK